MIISYLSRIITQNGRSLYCIYSCLFKYTQRRQLIYVCLFFPYFLVLSCKSNSGSKTKIIEFLEKKWKIAIISKSYPFSTVIGFLTLCWVRKWAGLYCRRSPGRIRRRSRLNTPPANYESINPPIPFTENPPKEN